MKKKKKEKKNNKLGKPAKPGIEYLQQSIKEIHPDFPFPILQ